MLLGLQTPWLLYYMPLFCKKRHVVWLALTVSEFARGSFSSLLLTLDSDLFCERPCLELLSFESSHFHYNEQFTFSHYCSRLAGTFSSLLLYCHSTNLLWRTGNTDSELAPNYISYQMALFKCKQMFHLIITKLLWITDIVQWHLLGLMVY